MNKYYTDPLPIELVIFVIVCLAIAVALVNRN